MDQPPKQSKVFISPPPMGEQPWLDNGAGYKKVLEMSPPDTASKMLKLFTDVENIDWPVCTFTLEGTMFGETYYAGAAFSIYLEVEGQANKVKINQKAIGELQQNFLNAISAA